MQQDSCSKAKAADLGNPDAQDWLGSSLSPIDKQPKVAKRMMFCAGEQGHARSAQQVGVDLQTVKEYDTAVQALQLGVKAGSSLAAGFLEGGFASSDPNDRLNYLAITPDPERARRYKEICRFLSAYEYLNPSVPELDDIVPLPPAKPPLGWQIQMAGGTQRQRATTSAQRSSHC